MKSTFILLFVEVVHVQK